MPGGIFQSLFGGKSKKKQETQSGKWTGAAAAVADRQPLRRLAEHRGQAQARPLPAPQALAPQPGAQPEVQPQVQPQSQPDDVLLGRSLGGGQVGDKELLTREKLLQRFAFQGETATMSEAKDLIKLVGRYEQTIKENPLPGGDSSDFITKMGLVNARIMTAHEHLITTLAEKSQTLRKKAQKVSERAIMPNEAAGVRLSVLADDCANLAMIAQTQKGYLNKIYDDMITAKRTNTEALRQFSGKTYAEILPHMEMYRFDSGAVALGAGGINTVYRANFQGADRVFKRGKAHEWSQTDEFGAELNMGVNVMADRLGYQPEAIRYGEKVVGRAIRDANTAQRDVAYSRLDKLFGFDIAVNTQLARSEAGESSSLMDMAQGETSNQFFVYYAGAEWSEAARSHAKEERGNDLALHRETVKELTRLYEEKRGRGVRKGESEEEFTRELEITNARLKEEKRLVERLERIGTYQTVDLADPRVALQLFKMAVLDAVAGHVDRHGGNYMISVTPEGPRIRAIDNDTSFGVATDIESKEGFHEGEVRPVLEEAFPFVPQEIKDKMMSVSRENLTQALAGLLSGPEIEAACIRLEKVQAHFEALEKARRVQEISRANLQELFKRNPQMNYHANLYNRSLHEEEWFRRTPPSPLPHPSAP